MNENSELILLDEWAVADILGVSTKTLQGWRWKGGGPKFIKLNGRLVRYREKDLVEWVASRERHSTTGGSNGRSS